MSLGTFALTSYDGKGSEIQPSPTPQIADLNTLPVPFRFDTLEQAHLAVGNSNLSTLPSLPVADTKKEISSFAASEKKAELSDSSKSVVLPKKK